MVEEYISKLKPFIEELFKDEDEGHDIGHLYRVMNIALHLCDKEGGDKIIVGISSFLHDIHRVMQKEQGKFISPKESLPTIKEILTNVELTGEQIDEICYCIEYHENYNWNENNVTNINALILQDADNLDALGAIGLARTFCYAGANKIKMYDENVPLLEETDFVEEDGVKESRLHHIYHKLFRLGKYMNTKTAREMSVQRTKIMRDFANQFLNEWNGKC